MPYVPALDTAVNGFSVIDENLEVRGAPGLFACDMSVKPLSCAANPVRTLAALALRLSRHLF
jgi:choline dehydrogenase-like flavoprotein